MSEPTADRDQPDQQDTPASYEAARAELADIVRALEAGGQPLEESLRLWQRGEHLADLCQQWLDGATARLDRAIAEHDRAEPGRPNPGGTQT